MPRVTGLILAAITMAIGAPASPAAIGGAAVLPAQRAESRAPLDVRELIAAGRGASPLLCALAADAVWGAGWRGWDDAPATPVSGAVRPRLGDLPRESLPAADVRWLMDNLAADDACVRELSVRLLGRQGGADVAAGFLERLGSNVEATREVAAFGLGLVRTSSAVDPLVRALRDAAPRVRANAAWALGRIDDGRAVAPLTGMIRDADAAVREATAIALGRLDSTSASAALIRALRMDEAPRVRRAAAWALGQLRVSEASDELVAALRQDASAEVREMAAWALGNREARGATGGLVAAVRGDESEAVRETAAWALGEGRDRSVAEVLGEVVAKDRSARVRGTAAWALGQLHVRVAPRGLIAALGADDADLRLKAAWALSEIGDSTAISPLRDALRRERDDRARKAEIRALMRSGERSEAALTELLQSKDAEVREAAVRGLAGGRAFDPWPWPWPRPRPVP